MSDAAIVQEPIEPAPEPAAAVDAAPAGAPDQVAPQADAPSDAPEIAFANGSLREAIIGHLADSVEAGPQSVGQILAALPAGVSRNTGESAIRRLFTSGEIERVAPGTYRLAPPKPPGQAKPSPPEPAPVRAVDHMTDQQWLDALEAFFVDPKSWDVEALGPGPDVLDNRIPPAVKVRMNDRLRKREERRRDAEVAAAKRAEADRQLLDRLLGACAGNFIRGPGLSDVAPIRAAMELVPLETILRSIGYQTDKKLYPANEPATSWREPRLLKSIAETYCATMIIPRLVDAWSRAESAPAKPVERAEARTAVQVPPDHENAPAPSSANGSTPPSELGPTAAALMQKFGHADGAPSPAMAPAVPDDGRPAVAGREAVMAAFARNRNPSPAQGGDPPRPAERPWFAGPQPKPQASENLSEDAVDELLSGVAAGTMVWPHKLLGPEPGPDCRVSRAVLRRHRLA